MTLFAAGERMGGFDVFDAVSSGDVQMTHTASFFWTGKVGASAAYFTTVPFGMTSEPYLGWLHYGGGQALWERLYAPAGILPRMAGNSGMTWAAGLSSQWKAWMIWRASKSVRAAWAVRSMRDWVHRRGAAPLAALRKS